MANGQSNGKHDRDNKHLRKDFKLEDARKLFVARSFALTIEKKLMEVVSSDDEKGTRFKAATVLVRDFLKALDQMRERQQGGQQHGRAQDCWDDYEPCNDGICRVWCSQ